MGLVKMGGVKRKRSPIKEEYFEDEEELSEYEKNRLKNIAERQTKFNELKIEDQVLDVSLTLKEESEKTKRNVSRRGLSAAPKEKVFEPVRKSLRLQKIDADTGLSLPEKEPTRYHVYEDVASSQYFGDRVKPFIECN